MSDAVDLFASLPRDDVPEELAPGPSAAGRGGDEATRGRRGIFAWARVTVIYTVNLMYTSMWLRPCQWTLGLVLLLCGFLFVVFLARNVVRGFWALVFEDLIGIPLRYLRKAASSISSLVVYESSVAAYVIQVHAANAAFVIGMRMGWIPPAVLPPLDTKYSAAPSPFQFTPYTHVDGIFLAHQVAVPYLNESYRHIPFGPSMPMRPVYLHELFNDRVPTYMKQLIAEKDAFPKMLPAKLDKARASLQSFRTALRKQPAAYWIKETTAIPPPWETPTVYSRLAEAWQAVGQALLSVILPSVESHLLRRLDELEGTLKKVTTAQETALGTLQVSALPRLKGPICAASSMAGSWQEVRGNVFRHGPPTMSGNVGHVAAGENGAASQADVASFPAIQVVLANLDHMCSFISADNKAIVYTKSKLVVDRTWYEKTVDHLFQIREHIKAVPLTSPAKVVAIERKLDDAARNVLEHIDTWEG